MPQSQRSTAPGPLASHHACMFYIQPSTCTPSPASPRWFSGDALPGTLTASSCAEDTWGDPALSVLSSPNPSGGPYSCVGGNDDNDAACAFNT